VRDGTWVPRRGVLRVMIGEAMAPGQTKTGAIGDDFARVVALRDRARTWILSHCGEPDLAHERPALLMREDQTR